MTIAIDPRRRSVLSTLRSDGCSTPSALLRPRGTVSTSRPSLARHRSRGSEAAVPGHVFERNGPQFASDNSRGRLPTARSRPLTFEYVCRADSAMAQELVNPCPGTSLTLVPGGHRSALPTQPCTLPPTLRHDHPTETVPAPRETGSGSSRGVDVAWGGAWWCGLAGPM